MASCFVAKMGCDFKQLRLLQAANTSADGSLIYFSQLYQLLYCYVALAISIIRATAKLGSYIRVKRLTVTLYLYKAFG